MSYLRNAWYVAAWGDEVTRSLTVRHMLGEPVLLYRKENGDAVAMSNRCPHRYASLHLGKLLGDHVQCAYHGLQFDCTGQCVLNPHRGGSEPIPRNSKIRSFPALERHGAIWVWMGEKDPDEALMPDYGFIDDTENYRTVRGVFDIDNHYEMVTDNALDLTHVTFTHAGSLGAGLENVSKEQVRRERIGNTLWCKRFNYDITAGADFQRFNPILQKIKVDKQQNVRWNPPCQILIVIRYVEADTESNCLTSIYAGNMLTPISGKKTRFFWSVSRNFSLDDDQLSKAMIASAELALQKQDKPMIEDQMTLMGTTDLESMQPVYIADDATPVLARRILKQLIEQEYAVTVLPGESASNTALVA